jgi:hypothetical protein
MSLLDNFMGNRNVDGGDQGGKFNPFRLLEIGEIMVRYTDGIRIKDFVFLAILTSERLILIDSTRQGAGQITKEIPFSVIKQADLERDERDRPSLAISMEVGGQSRVMHLVFTGLIEAPDSECREWFTAINGYPPEQAVVPEIRLDEPVIVPTPPGIRQDKVIETEIPESRASTPVPGAVPPAPPVSKRKVVVAEPVPAPAPAPVADVIPPPPPVDEKKAVVAEPVPEPAPVLEPAAPAIVQERTASGFSRPRGPVPSAHPVPATPVPGGYVRIQIEKPDVHPFRVPVESVGDRGYRNSATWKFCIQCGARNSSSSRFCQTCGSRQT